MPTENYAPKTPKQLRAALDEAGAADPPVVASPEPSSELAASVDASALPTTDPLVAGQLWNNAGVLTVSAG